jgi:hypothetical protein
VPTRGPEMRYISVLERGSKTIVLVPYWRSRKVAAMEFRSADEIGKAKAALAN